MQANRSIFISLDHIKHWGHKNHPHDYERGGSHAPLGSPRPYRTSLHQYQYDIKVHDHDRRRSPLSGCILDSKIPKSIKKPSKLDSYNGTGDPKEHIEHIDTMFIYYHGEVKSKLFVLKEPLWRGSDPTRRLHKFLEGSQWLFYYPIHYLKMETNYIRHT